MIGMPCIRNIPALATEYEAGTQSKGAHRDAANSSGKSRETGSPVRPQRDACVHRQGPITSISAENWLKPVASLKGSIWSSARREPFRVFHERLTTLLDLQPAEKMHRRVVLTVTIGKEIKLVHAAPRTVVFHSLTTPNTVMFYHG